MTIGWNYECRVGKSLEISIYIFGIPVTRSAANISLFFSSNEDISELTN